MQIAASHFHETCMSSNTTLIRMRIIVRRNIRTTKNVAFTSEVKIRITMATVILWPLVGGWVATPVAGDDILPELVKIGGLSRLPANTWTLIGADLQPGLLRHAARTCDFLRWRAHLRSEPEDQHVDRPAASPFADRLPATCLGKHGLRPGQRRSGPVWWWRRTQPCRRSTILAV